MEFQFKMSFVVISYFATPQCRVSQISVVDINSHNIAVNRMSST